jgi:hypothetical protein
LDCGAFDGSDFGTAVWRENQELFSAAAAPASTGEHSAAQESIINLR